MKIQFFVLRALLTTAVLLGAGAAQAQILITTSSDDSTTQVDFAGTDSATVTAFNKVESAAASNSGSGAACPQCENCGCNSLCGCDNCSPYELYFFSGIDSFNGMPNRGEEISNFGFTNGLNAGFALPGLREYGIGGQIGINYVVSNLEGSYDPNESQTTEQTFFTLGIFRHAHECQPISWGIAYDFMTSNNLGEFGQAPTLGQWRGQIGYAWNDCNEIGVWVTLHDRNTVTTFEQFPFKYRAMDQANLYWHHKYCECGADSTLYVGLPTQDSLSLGVHGAVILGTNLTVPLSDRLALFADGMYMPSTQPAGTYNALAAETWNVSFGVNIYLGRSTSRSSTVAGNCFSPLLPVANNGSFLVETNGLGPI